MPTGVTGDSPSDRRDLIVLDPVARQDAGASAHNPRPAAAFLAQLIATALKAPQTRQRRRAGADHAAALYAVAAALPHTGTVARSV